MSVLFTVGICKKECGYRWTLEYIGNSRDGCSTPQHHLATLNSAAAASAATETMSEEASAAGDLQWPRGARSPPISVRHPLLLRCHQLGLHAIIDSSCILYACQMPLGVDSMVCETWGALNLEVSTISAFFPSTLSHSAW